MAKSCIGQNITNPVDEVLDSIEKDISVAAGKGLLSEDKYNEISDEIETIRNSNDVLKCLVESIPKEEVNVEDIVNEIGETKSNVGA